MIILPQDDIAALDFIAEYLLGNLRHEDTKAEQEAFLLAVGQRLNLIATVMSANKQ